MCADDVFTGRTERTLEAPPPSIWYILADIARAEDSARVIAELSAPHGRLHVLVNTRASARHCPCQRRR